MNRPAIDAAYLVAHSEWLRGQIERIEAILDDIEREQTRVLAAVLGQLRDEVAPVDMRPVAPVTGCAPEGTSGGVG